MFQRKRFMAWINSIGAVRSTVLEKDELKAEIRYFITSLTDAKMFANSVRNHWSIESQLHWQLDVTFREDTARTRKDNSPLVWNVMRKMALPLIRNANCGRKTSIKHKRYIAVNDISFLEIILGLK
jgi:predicted transposase YbfD/YdcC